MALVLGCCAITAHADGGRLQLRQAAGPFVISLFSTPESLGVGPADLSVMVEEQGSGNVLLDADVTLTLTSEVDRVAPVIAHVSHAHATNRLLQDAVVQLPHAGRWHAIVHVSEAGREVSVATDLAVANHSPVGLNAIAVMESRCGLTASLLLESQTAWSLSSSLAV